MNERGLRRRPGPLGRRRPDAHLRRARPSRRLRRPRLLRPDAFEGLRTLDRLVELKRSGRATIPPSGARSPNARSRGAAASTPAPRRHEGLPRRAPDVDERQPALHPAVRRAVRVAKGISIDEIAEYLNLTALFRNQWGFRPEKPARTTRRSRNASGRSCASSWPSATAEDLLVPQVVWGHFPATPRATTSSSTRTTTREPSGCASPSRASARSRGFASPTSSGRPTSAKRTTPPSCS